jgi:hypothetical protein
LFDVRYSDDKAISVMRAERTRLDTIQNNPLANSRAAEWARVRYALMAVPEGFPDISVAWWEADHIVPVVEGGGECGIDGYRTLCVPCHKTVTANLAARLAEKRRLARQPELFCNQTRKET